MHSFQKLLNLLKCEKYVNKTEVWLALVTEAGHEIWKCQRTCKLDSVLREEMTLEVWKSVPRVPLTGTGSQSESDRKCTGKTVPGFLLQPRRLPLPPPNGRRTGWLQRQIGFAESQPQHCRAGSRKEGLDLKGNLLTGIVIIRRILRYACIFFCKLLKTYLKQ